MEGFFKGTQVSNYKILSLIGKGGMGEVYKAQHVHLETLAAIKILVKNLETDIGLIKSFIREARTAAQIKHNNVVEVYDVGETDAYWYLIMEYVPGIDCAKLIRTHRIIPISDAVKIIKAAACGLQAVHERGLIHRDIKPHNLYITKQLVVKVGDFGLVQYQKTLQELSNKIAGTPAYMAPEQVMDVKKIGPTTDIYSLGVTLYQMITGQQPYQGKGSHEILFALFRGEEFPSCRDLVPDIPEELNAIVKKMVEREQYNRYQNMQEVIQVLDEFEKNWAPPPGATVLSGESLLTESCIQGMSDSATHQSTHLDTPPAELLGSVTREQKIITVQHNIISSELASVTDILDRGGTEEMSSDLSHNTAIGQLTPLQNSAYHSAKIDEDVANERATTSTLPMHLLPKPISTEATFDEHAEKHKPSFDERLAILERQRQGIASEATFDESASHKIVATEITMDEHRLGATEERNKPIPTPPATMVYVKPEERPVANFRLYFAIILGIFLFVLVIVIWMLINPTTVVTLQLLALTNENSEIRTEFELNEPVILMASFECQGKKLKPFPVTIQGEGIETIQSLVTPTINQPTCEIKIPLQFAPAKPGDYAVKISYTFGKSFEQTASFKLIPPQFDLVLKEAYLTNESGKFCREFYQGELIKLFLQWTISSRRPLPSSLRLDVTGAIQQKQLLIAQAIPNDYTQTVSLQKAQDPGQQNIKIRLTLENKTCEKDVAFLVKKQPQITITSIKIVDRSETSRPIYEYGTEVYLLLEWSNDADDFDSLKIELQGEKIANQQHQIPIANGKTMIPIALNSRDPGKYGITVLVSKASTLLASQNLEVEWKAPDPKLSLENAVLMDSRKNIRTEFLPGETVYCKVQWRCADASSNLLKLRIMNSDMMYPLDRTLGKGNGNLQEITLPLNVRYIPGTYNLQINLTLGTLDMQRLVPIKLREPELQTIEISPINPKLKKQEQIKFTAFGYSKDRQRVTMNPIWKAQGGTITNDGVYVAGNEPGTYEILVMDAQTKIEAKTQVEIPQTLARITLNPNTNQTLQPRESIVLQVQGYSSTGSPVPFTPTWQVTGGQISTGANPYEVIYSASEQFGDFQIIVSDSMDANITTNLGVHVELTGGWFGEALPEGLTRGEQIGEYIWKKDESIMVYIPPDDSLLLGFYIDKYELSAGQFEQFSSMTGYKSDAEAREHTWEFDGRRFTKEAKSWRSISNEWGKNYPVVYLSPKDMQNYGRWAGKMLPSKNQWLKAAGRSFKIPDWGSSLPIKLQNNPSPGRKYPWGDESYRGRCNIARSWNTRGEDGFAFLAPTSKFSKEGASPFGCVNMAGNVYELTSDSFLFGGAWCYPETFCNLHKVITPPDLSVGNNYIGCRFVLSED